MAKKTAAESRKQRPACPVADCDGRALRKFSRNTLPDDEVVVTLTCDRCGEIWVATVN